MTDKQRGALAAVMSEELERLAKYASSGPWTVDERLEAGCVRGRYGDIIVMETELLSDAAFIAAANPATILDLLSERAELLATVERMQGLLEQMADLLQIANRSTDRPSGYVSRIVIAARAALATGEATGSPIGQNDQPGLAFSDAGEP